MSFLNWSKSFYLRSLPISDWWHSLDLTFDVQGALVGAQHDASPVGHVEAELVWSTVTLLLFCLKPSTVGILDPLMSSKPLLIGFVQDEMITIPLGSNVIALIRIIGMEVEDKEQLSFFVNDDLVLLICLSDELMLRYHGFELNFCLVHYDIKLTQLAVSEVLIISQVPLSSAVIITITIALSWEVNPFRMSKLISHEVQISLSSETLRYESNHLVQGHSSGNSKSGLKKSTHASVDISVEQPHRMGFVSYDSLVMTFGITDNFLLPSPVGETVSDVTHVPVFVWATI